MTDFEQRLRNALAHHSRDVTSDPDRVRPGARVLHVDRSNDSRRRLASPRVLTLAACALLVAGTGIGLAVLSADDRAVTDSDTKPPASPRGVVAVDVDATALDPLDSLTDDSVVVPTVMVESLTVQPTLVYDGPRSVTRAESDDEATWLEVSNGPGYRPLESTAATETAELGDRTWSIRETGGLTSAFVEIDGIGVSVTSGNVARDDFTAVLEQLRVGTPESAPAGSYRVDDDSNIVFASGDGLRLNREEVGPWTCWSIFEGTQLQATFGSCAQPTPQSDGAVVIDTFSIAATDGDPSGGDGSTNIISTTFYVVGTVPADAVAVSVAVPGIEPTEQPVGPIDSATGARFFVATAVLDGDHRQLEPTVEAVIPVPSSTRPG